MEKMRVTEDFAWDYIIEGHQIGNYILYSCTLDNAFIYYDKVLNAYYVLEMETKDWNKAESYVRGLWEQDYADMLHLC